MMRMGIDYGGRRIGIAISNPAGTMAVPLVTIEVKADGSHLEKIRDLCVDYHIEELVIGLPYNMNGSLGESGNKVIAWAEVLKEQLGLPVVFWDERLTSCQAHTMLSELNVKGRRRKQAVDQLAASIILSDYLQTCES